MNLAARATRSRLSHLPKIIFPAEAQNSFFRRTYLLPELFGIFVRANFVITLKPDGVARKTIGPKNSGTWKVVNGEAQVSWDDGWHDVIRKVGNKYEKAAFSPDNLRYRIDFSWSSLLE